MAPKITCNPVKLTSIVSYFHKSRTAHSIKDLEKALPSVATINGMQVKDYLQTLQDEDKINVEKIGSGNWYWSFNSQDRKLKECALGEARSASEKMTAIVAELRGKLSDFSAQRDETVREVEGSGDRREDVIAEKALREIEIKALGDALAAYKDSDSTELKNLEDEIKTCAREAEQYTDDIYSMEGWFKKNGMDDALPALRMSLYGDQYDTEEFALKDLE